MRTGGDRVKAISLWQPWASAIALGLKSIETRGWSTDYRGPLAIHAAQRWTRAEQDFARGQGLPENLPLGAVVAVANLTDVLSTEYIPTDRSELSWGDYGPGRFGWLLDNIHALERPVPFKGKQGFFSVPDDMLLGVLPALYSSMGLV
jgi:hypothetical protein